MKEALGAEGWDSLPRASATRTIGMVASVGFLVPSPAAPWFLFCNNLSGYVCSLRWVGAPTTYVSHHEAERPRISFLRFLRSTPGLRELGLSLH